MNEPRSRSEVARLETLWQGEFGDEYIERNISAGEGRLPFWEQIFTEYPVNRVLEVGCNIGANLRWIEGLISGDEVFGIDINRNALAHVRQTIPNANVVWGVARELPFRDGWFDLVFTTGVLIHQPLVSLPIVMSEIVRCSRQYILCGEYYSEEPVEVAYRGQEGALIKQDFGRLYQELFPDLRLCKQGFLGPDDGWDSLTYWLFEKD